MTRACKLTYTVVGKSSQHQALPIANAAGQQHRACKLLHSAKQAAFVFFYRVLEGAGRGAGLLPGALEWTLIPEGRLSEEKYMQWTAPGTMTSWMFKSKQAQYKSNMGFRWLSVRTVT